MKPQAILAGLTVVLLATSANSQSFPAKPISMIVGYAAGGTVDIQARGLAKELAEELGQPVNVINQPGAGAAVAASRLKNAAPDGYTIMLDNSSTLTFTPLITEVDFVPADFRVIAAVAQSQPAFVVSGNSAIESFDDLVAQAKSQGRVTYATQTQVDRLIVNQLAEENDIEISIVPTGGGGGMAPLLLGGQVDFAYSGGLHVNYLESGQMKVIASLNSNPLTATPDAPTLKQIGLDYGVDNYRLVYTPADVPDEIARILEAAVIKAAESESFREITEDQLQFPMTVLTAAELVPELSDADARSKRLVEQSK